MKIIVASGGSGTRMRPVTSWINKHLIPIGKDELMIDMPLKYLSRNGIKSVTIVTGSNHATQVCEYVQDGDRYGFVDIEYKFQVRPLGISDVLKRVSCSNEDVLLILGDNFFEINELNLKDIVSEDKAMAWEYDVGSVEKAKAFGQFVDGCIVEKPQNSNRSFIITGLYYFPKDVMDKINKLTPSARNELEITHLLDMYLKENRLRIKQVTGKWFDLGEQDTWIEFMKWRS